MSQGTRSKVALHSKTGIDSSNEDDHEDVKASASYITQSKSTSKDNRGSLQSNPSPMTMGESFIVKHNLAHSTLFLNLQKAHKLQRIKLTYNNFQIESSIMPHHWLNGMKI